MKIVLAVITMLAMCQYNKAQTADALDSIQEEKFASYYKLPSKSKPKISSSTSLKICSQGGNVWFPGWE